MKIICIGRNYVDHAIELNNKVPENPVFFMKPDSALLLKNRPFYIPEFSKEIHHEVEVVVRINRLGKHIDEKFAHRYYSDISLGIDFTARDIQNECKAKGLPWEIAKSFDSSAPLGSFIKLDKLKNKPSFDFELHKNNQVVQKGNTSEMIFSIDRIISYISKFLTLKIGDLIYTGTPHGVGPVEIGDNLTGYLEGIETFNFAIK
jgi:2-keto-4-pentenoate hydratase/2-oxohepta-3-ene-1,7-dioic acid hydratase in catechol pathway